MVTFLYGCAATFGGVFIIAWAPTRDVDLGDNEDVEALEGVAGEGSAGGEGSGPSDGLGTIGRRRRATLVLPSGVRDPPVLGKRQSAVSLIGLSPAQVR